MKRGVPDDFDAQATGGRATRRKNQRTRQAGRLVPRTDWLSDTLVFWTGEPEAIPRLENAPLPLRAVLQDRLADLPAGLYAVRLDLPDAARTHPDRSRREPSLRTTSGPLHVRVTALDVVTPSAWPARRGPSRPRRDSRRLPPASWVPWTTGARRCESDWPTTAARRTGSRRGARAWQARWRSRRGRSGSAEVRSLALFCKGYVDTPEALDWWIEALAAEEPGFGEHDGERLRRLLQEPVPAVRDARTAPDWRREELGWEACRALLWLGIDAPSLAAEQEQALGLGRRHRATLTGKG
ncbi:MAG: hypothetical protein NT151_10250 [Acidobacteria bacterium]|nr:hypothetical protein [Acidobacteriota bacterium]